MDSTTCLIQAAYMDDDHMVHELIRAGASVTAMNQQQKQRALHIACKEGHSSVAKALIEAGADINGQDEDGTTLLMQGAYRGDDQMVHELIRAGASATAKNKKLQTALHLAISSRSRQAQGKGHSSVVKALIEAGADVNGQDEDGTTPLMQAACGDDDQMVHELIRAGASVTAMNKQWKQRALHIACMEGHSSVIKALVKAGADVNGQDEDGTTLLMEAAYRGDDQVVHELIRAGASVSAKNNKQQTALHTASNSESMWAPRKGFSSVVNALIEAGAKINGQDEDGTTPLMQAAYRGDDQMVHELIRAGASVTAKNNNQQTALFHLAISSRSWWAHSTVVKALIEAGADINGQDEDGTTPLMQAAYKGHYYAVLELVKAGASVTAMNQQQKQRALRIACKEGHSSVVKALIEAGADINGQDEDGTTPLMEATCGYDDQMVHELIRAGASVSVKNNKQQTALHTASNSESMWGPRKGLSSVVKALIEAGADINGQDEDGTTLLMQGAYRGDGQVVHELIRAGASATAKNKKLQTALHLAISSSRWAYRKGRSSVVKALIEAGADVSGQDEDGTTPLMQAACGYDDQMVHELIRAGASVTAMNKQQKQRALHIACKEGHSSVIKALVEAGTDVNGQDEDGRTLLMEAAYRGDDQMVHELIRASASVSAKDNKLQTALHLAFSSSWWAHQKGRSSVVKALIEAGADINGQDEDGTTPLMQAACRYDDQMVHELIRAGASVSAKNNKQQTALHTASNSESMWAPRKSLTSVVNALIEAGADIDGQDEDGTTPLMDAAYRGDDQMAHELIRAGASVTTPNKKLQTALHLTISSSRWAYRKGCSSVVKALIEAGADINGQDEDGTTPLMEAACGYDDQMVHELIRAGASVTAKNNKQQTALFHLAISSRSGWAHSTVVKALIEAGADINGQDEDGTTPLMQAAYKGHYYVVLELIRAGASVTAMNKQQKQRALHIACKEGHSSVVKALIEAGADINGQDEDGTTPLMEAACWYDDQMVHELIRAGASVSAKNNKQQTALHTASNSESMWAPRKGLSSVVNALIEAGADINGQDEDGTTLLMQAAYRGDDQMVHELIRAGASATAKNKKLQTALHLAISSTNRRAQGKGHSSIVKALIEAGADVNGQDEDGTTPLMQAACGYDDQMVHELIRAGASVTAMSKQQKQRALHIACKEGHSSVIKALVEAGADVNGQDEDGRTLLMEAAYRGDDQMVHELIRAGASVSAKDNKLQTAFHLAFSSSWWAHQKGRSSVVKALIEAGADINGQDKDGTTPLMKAAYKVNDQMVHELIRAGASVSAKNSKQQTALHTASNSESMWAPRKSLFSVVNALIEAGADINGQDEDGTTPLMDAAYRGDDQMAHELIRAGASVTVKNNKQQTALFHLAISSRSWWAHSTVVKALIEAGADINGQDEDGTTPLMQAAYKGQYYAVLELIKAGASVTAMNRQQKQRALHIACKEGHFSVVKALIEAGADINGQDEDGTTPLMEAAYRGDGQVVHELIRAGASATAKNKKLQTALHLAISSSRWAYRKGRSSIVKALIEAGADVSGQDEDGTTPLMQAACGYDDQMVHELIRAGASAAAKNKKLQTALHLAINSRSRWAQEKGHSSIVKALIKAGADVNGQDEDGTTPLMQAACGDDDQMVLELIRAGASVTAMSKQQKQRALRIACKEGHSSVIKALVKAGADVNEQDEDGTTLFMVAAYKGYYQVMHELIRAGASVSAKNKEVQAALNLAICCVYVHRNVCSSIVNALIELGVGINGQDEDGTTPLMQAAYKGHCYAVLELIRVGASVTAMNQQQKQEVLHIACKEGHPSVIKALIEAGTDVDGQDEDGTTPLMQAAYKGHYYAVLELIRAGASVTAMNQQQKQRALRIACKEGHSSVVKALIEAGADVNGQNEDGTTPLLEAACGYDDQMVHELIRAGASVTAMNKQQKQRALHIACKEGHSSVIKALVEAGADVNGQDEDGRSLLMKAAGKGHYYVVHELIGAGASVTSMNKQQKQRALHTACKEGHSSVMKTLIEAGADVNGQDEDGTTPLMNAAMEGHEQMVLKLIRAGASINAISTQFYCYSCLAAKGSTALHFAAQRDKIKCGVLLVEAGADLTARNNDSKSPLDHASVDFKHHIQQAQSVSAKRIVAVIGNAEHGKSTLIAALKAEGNSLWTRFINRFAKVQNVSQRTTGIEAVQFSSQRYGETLFYDFAGQSDYHGPHQSFLEAMLSKPGLTVTLLVLVKATDEADIITQQINCWLQPLALVSTPSTPQVVLVGSFLDQVNSREEATEKLVLCTQTVQKELPYNIQGTCLLDCRYPESEGINQICSFFVENQPLLLNSNIFSYNLHWVLVQVRRAFSIPAITLHTFQSWVLESVELLPLHLPPPEEVCRDLTAVGHALFLPNRQDPYQSWLILDLQAILHDVYGTLFSSSKGKVNKFGLLHCSQLAELFPKLDQAMIQEVLISLEFCTQVDPLLIKKELLKLTTNDDVEGWLYFPALVSAQPLEVFPGDLDPQHLQWVCWQLRTMEKHFISAHLLQTIILRLAANHVFTHELSPSVREHCCSVGVNGLSWRSTKGVDIAVQISDSSVVQVVGRSKAGPEELYQYTSTVVQTVIQTTTQQTPKLEATSYIVHPYEPETWDDPKVPPPDSLYPVSSIVSCINDQHNYVLSLPKQDGRLPHQMSLPELFGGWSPPLSVVEDMDFKREPQRGVCVCVCVCVRARAHLSPCMSAWPRVLWCYLYGVYNVYTSYKVTSWHYTCVD